MSIRRIRTLYGPNIVYRAILTGDQAEGEDT